MFGMAGPGTSHAKDNPARFQERSKIKTTKKPAANFYHARVAGGNDAVLAGAGATSTFPMAAVRASHLMNLPLIFALRWTGSKQVA